MTDSDRSTESMNPGSLRMTRLYCAYQFFFSLLLWVPIFYEFQKRVGLSDPDIFRIQSIYYVAFCVLELPTGYLADKLGARWCLRAGALVLLASNLLPIFFQDYPGFLFHFLLIALSRSLVSGASSAYLYESLRAAGISRRYQEVEGRARSYGLIGKVVCWGAVGFLMNWHLTLPYWLTAGSAAIAVAFAFLLPEVSGSQQDRAGAGGLAVFDLGFLRALRAKPSLLLLMLQGVAVFVMARIVQVNLFQPILKSKSFGVEAFGLVMALMSAVEALASYRSRTRMSPLKSVFWVTAGMGASLVVISGVGAWGTLGCLVVFSVCCGISFPIQKQLLNDAIPDSRFRATLLSMESLLDRAVCAGVVLVLGVYVSDGKIAEFLVIAGVVSTLAAGCVTLLYGWVCTRGQT